MKISVTIGVPLVTRSDLICDSMLRVQLNTKWTDWTGFISASLLADVGVFQTKKKTNLLFWPFFISTHYQCPPHRTKCFSAPHVKICSPTLSAVRLCVCAGVATVIGYAQDHKERSKVVRGRTGDVMAHVYMGVFWTFDSALCKSVSCQTALVRCTLLPC